MLRRRTGLRHPAIAFVGVEDVDCPDCGHTWNLHPGASVWVSICAECVYDEDVGERTVEAMCLRVPPDDWLLPAGLTLRARIKQRRWRGARVYVEDAQGFRWAVLRPPLETPEATRRLLDEVNEDLATMPVLPLRAKYEPLME